MFKLTYLTYQVFPNEKANTIQTIRMLESLSSLGVNTQLIFPDRGNVKNDNEAIIKFYEIENKFKISKYSHKLPFNKFNLRKLENINFLMSSYIWSLIAVKKYFKTVTKEEIIMTRTHWVLYFASKYKNKIIYECHKFSKIDNFILRRLQFKENVIVIFPNEELQKQFNLSGAIKKNSLILQSAFDEKLYPLNDFEKVKNKVVFVGNLLRFNNSRNLEFLINTFHDARLENFNLTIIGGPSEVAKQLAHSLSKNTTAVGRLSQKDAIKEIASAEIGLLINHGSELHSYLHTSPIKYFEYLRGGLKILAVDFPSHKNLPLNKNNFYFSEDNKEDFINKLITASNTKFYYEDGLQNYSYNSRTKKLLSHIARLEGLEPPTL